MLDAVGLQSNGTSLAAAMQKTSLHMEMNKEKNSLLQCDEKMKKLLEH